MGEGEHPVVMPVGFMSNHTVAELIMERDRLREALQAVMDSRFSSNTEVLTQAWEKAREALDG